MEQREMTPTEERAVRRVQRAIAQAPSSIGFYFHGDSATVIACEEGEFPFDGEDVDRAAILDIIDTPRCRAGSW